MLDGVYVHGMGVQCKIHCLFLGEIELRIVAAVSVDEVLFGTLFIQRASLAGKVDGHSL